MATLYLKFAVVLEDFGLEPYSVADGQRHHGPLFHRWLPDGERAAISLPTFDPKATLQVWFERTGYVEGGRIKFDYERAEIDPELIPLQDILDAGPLRGMIKVEDPDDEILFALQQNIVGGPPYVNFGRRIYRMLHPQLHRFLGILRSNFGQYWINELSEWDPNLQSLGTYFSTIIQMRWSADEAGEWRDFVPEPPETLHPPEEASPPDYRNYLGAADWDELQRVVQQHYVPSLAATTLVRTHRLIEEHALKQALVEGVTALEIAINEYVQGRLHSSRMLADRLPFFWKLSLADRLVALATTLNVPLPEVEGTVKCVDLRNRMVHESSEPPQSAWMDLQGLLQTVGSLLPGPRFRFPAYHIHTPPDTP